MRPKARRAVAAVIRRADGLVLAVRRPDEPGEELPGVWGLPAATLRDGESVQDGIQRLGRDKLGVDLTPLRVLGEGDQPRPDYTLRMTLYEASCAGEPSAIGGPAQEPRPTLYTEIDWLPAASFGEAAARGSLCSRLFLKVVTP